MTKRYTVGVLEWGGWFPLHHTDDREEMARLFVAETDKWGSRGTVTVANNDRADYDTAGLTEDDEDAIETAEYLAHAEAA